MREIARSKYIEMNGVDLVTSFPPDHEATSAAHNPCSIHEDRCSGGFSAVFWSAAASAGRGEIGGIGTPNSFHRDQCTLYANEFQAMANNNRSTTSNTAGSTSGTNTIKIARRQSGSSLKLRFTESI